jgi:hypothetical protein
MGTKIEIESQSQTGIATRRRVAALFLASAFGAFGLPAMAQEEAPSNEELARRIEALAEELDDLKLGEVAKRPESRFGLGPSASKVYGVERGMSLGGYGEMVYQDFAAQREDDMPSNKSAQIDYLRQVLYVGYKFDDHVVFNSEIEIEHASTSKGGSVSVEFATLDFFVHSAVNARIGMVLVPMGFINELHEPPTFFGVQRPEVERRIIPTTWRANGFGGFGEPVGRVEGLSYRAYVIESLRSVGESTRFTAEGVRSGRQKGAKALAEDVAGVVRADYERRGVLVGGSVFVGNTSQGATAPGPSGPESFRALTTLYEAHVQFAQRGLRIRGLFTGGDIQDAEKINAANEFTGNESVGSRLLGWYVDLGYDVLVLAAPGSRMRLVPYVRYEELDTQQEVPTGFERNLANDQQILTAGFSFYPHSQVVLKTDYEVNRNAANTGVNQWNFGLGYNF